VDAASVALSGRRSMAAVAAASGTGSTTQGEECVEAIALCYRCVALLAELWGLLWVSASSRGRSFDRQPVAGISFSSDPLQALLLRMEPPLQAALPALLAQMAAAAPPGRDDVLMPDAVSGMAVSTVESALYPSGPTRFAICSRILSAWRRDAVTRQIQALGEERKFMQEESRLSSQAAPWSTWQAASSSSSFTGGATTSGLTPELVAQVRVRSGVLCTVFVHACSSLLNLRLVDPSPSAAERRGDGLSGGGQQLYFDGCVAEFRHLLLIVEVSLHLLCTHLAVLAAAADLQGSVVGSAGSGVTAGTPRPAVVAQYLRLLRDFGTSAGGSVALAEARAATMASGVSSTAPSVAVANLAFVSGVAARAEELVSQLQLQHIGI